MELSLWSNMYPCLCLFAVFLTTVLFSIQKFVKTPWYHFQEAMSKVPPGSRGLPFIGETVQFVAAINSSKGVYEFVRVRSLRYGHCFKTNIFGKTHVFVSSTEAAKAILNNDTGRFTKSYIKSIAELLGDNSLLCASRQHHKFIRSRLINLFSSSSISDFIILFDELVVKSLSSWDNKGTVIVLDQTNKITLKAMCKLLMSIEDEEELEMLQENITRICEAMLAFPLRFPQTRFYKGLQARQRIMIELERIMTERRRCSEAKQEDFLQHLLTGDGKSCSDEARRLTDSEIKDNLLTMIIAGQDTTASAMAWMVKYLGENQDALDRVMAEQLRITSERSFLTLEDLSEMPYASKVVKESLRMATVVSWLPRLALEGCEIEGFSIEKGWNVDVNARSIHHDPCLYDHPNVFNPSRFDDESKPYSFLAFGMGGRTCLGMNMAKGMMLVFLHRLATTYRWQVLDSDCSIEKLALFSRLKSGCPVRVTRII